MQQDTIDSEQTAAGGLDKDEYFVSEIFYSIQGEGVNIGEPMVFVRFGGCNLRCRKESVGFDCDTDFQSGQVMSADEIAGRVHDVRPDGAHRKSWILFTGGEPGLQIDPPLLETLTAKCNDPRYSVETNGTVDIPFGTSQHWICVSPKSAWHTIRQRTCNELKLVRSEGQQLPDLDDTPISAKHQIVSPACQPDGSYRHADLSWCVELVKQNPDWRLSLQTHKRLGVR
jgi:organic radical activating enzyme